MNPTTIQIAGALLFALALVHTFSTTIFEKLTHRHPRHAGAFHFLGEVEVVFGFWALVLAIFMLSVVGKQATTDYMESRNYTEPLFVFAIMVVAASKPILQLCTLMVQSLARLMPVNREVAVYFLALSFIPLLGSFITEPAAMTLAALMLRDRIYAAAISDRLKYATIGVLFVNISIGGTLTPFAAPPVLMVAAKWNWDLAFMITHIGWKAAVAVFCNTLAVTLLFRSEITASSASAKAENGITVSMTSMVVCVLFLAGVVIFGHYPSIFMGLLLFFLGYTAAYKKDHDRLILREALLVAFFLAGLVVLGGQQQWWLEPLLISMSPDAVYYLATALTAITDNAALTYLGSLVEGLSDEFKYSLVTGAVTGGGLTVIANAPNPAGFAILRGSFKEGAISALWLLFAALGPTLVAVAAFRLL